MATIPRSWTSDLARIALIGLLVLPTAHAGPLFGLFGKGERGDGDVSEEPEARQEDRTPAPNAFEDPLPLALGTTPPGLASTSAQACNACHFGTHDAWATSGHATGWRSEAFRDAVEEVGTPACTVCHLPIETQHAERWTYDAEIVDRPVTAPSGRWDPTLAIEGVTCAACHVRDGLVLAASAPAPDTVAPHPLGWTRDLGRSESCAACHQLTWPGADRPFYDTYGEWSRSPHAEAGIQCQDCHMGAGAGEQRLGADHAFRDTAGRAVSVHVDLASPRIVRGGEPVEGTVWLQNTGAGHAFPTGSPFRGVRLEVSLVGPDDAEVALVSDDLARTLDDAPPWRTTRDTRLAVGEERAWDLSLALGQDLPAGDWTLRIVLRPTVRGVVGDEPLLARRVPVRVE